MKSKMILAGTLLLLANTVNAATGKSYTIPIKKTLLSKPVTKTQKMLTDYHHKYLLKKYEGLLQLKGSQVKEEGKKRLKQSIDMINNMNLAYTGPVHFGTPTQMNDDSEFVYDTGSGYLTTTSTSCSSCGSKYYDPDASNPSSVSSGSGRKELDYGSASLVGYLGSDQVCLAENMCVSDFEFFVITKQSGLTGYDGILGMSPPDESQNGPSYIKALHD